MTTEESLTAWSERFSDYLNPILVKETRQALKSRQFIVTFMLLLIVAWLISAVGVLLSGSSIEYGSPGRSFVMFYTFILEFAVLLVVPFTAFRSMQIERELATFEMLNISTLKPRQIVWGKLCSALVQLFLFYSAIAPFVAFTSLLQGFDLPSTAFLLVTVLLWSVMACMIALTLSTLANNRQWQSLNMLGILGALFAQMCMSFGFAMAVMQNPVPFGDEEFWFGMAAALIAAASFFWLFQQIAIARLTFESDNRSTGIRIACSVQVCLLWLCIVGYGLYQEWNGMAFDKDSLSVGIVLSLLHWSVVGLYACCESDFISRRIRRGIPRSKFLRLLVAPWLPGGSRALVFYLAHMLAFAVIAAVVDFGPQGLGNKSATAMLLYSVIYITWGAGIGRVAQAIAPQIQPAHTRVLTVLVAGLAMLAPMIPAAVGLINRGYGWNYTYSLMDITNPFATLSYLGQYPNGPQAYIALFVLWATAAAGVLFNVRAMSRGILEIVTYKSPTVPTQAEASNDISEAVEVFLPEAAG